MERVKKGERYWYISATSFFDNCIIMWRCDMRGVKDNKYFNGGNYFCSLEEAEACVKKLRAVLKGADVIEMPSEKELQAAEDNYIGHPFQLDEGVTTSMCRTAFGAGIGWLLKSKIVK